MAEEVNGKRRNQPTHRCQVCGKLFAGHQVLPAFMVRESLVQHLTSKGMVWQNDGYICLTDLNLARRRYFEWLIESERGELSDIEKSVVKALEEHDVISQKIGETDHHRLSFGERLSDRIAEFGGSWAFISLFFLTLGGWILYNFSTSTPFDPYPFILLNLILSCLAAVQAPIIMMSQNRQDARDRARSEQDYKVNLKSEVEVRVLNEKIDRLVSHQWQRLLEIQEMQLDLMNELTHSQRKLKPGQTNGGS